LKALLLVGGLATRLRSLSINRPKCLFPLQNKPILDYLLENLATAGADEVILAVNNHAEKIQEYLGDEKYGVRLVYNREKSPLGTGGPIKLAEKYLCDDDFLVLNGDVLSFIDYQELMYIHRKNKTDATITLKQVEDPSRYGVVRLSGDRILKFVEKPKKSEAPSNWINAGCYALSPEIFDYIPPNTKISIERMVFPRLAAENQLHGYKYPGEWMDIGVPRDYLRANKILQTNKSMRSSSISPSTAIGEGSQVLDSIVWENTEIGRNTAITDTIIGSNCVIGDNVKIDYAAIGDNVHIEDLLVIAEGTKIWPDKIIEESVTRINTEIK
jgi:mannose-1-phosphate guanylyltransferase